MRDLKVRQTEEKVRLDESTMFALNAMLAQASDCITQVNDSVSYSFRLVTVPYSREFNPDQDMYALQVVNGEGPCNAASPVAL